MANCLGCIKSFLSQAWKLKYIADGGDTSIKYKPIAILPGLKKDRATLEKYGVLGFPPIDNPAQPVRTWDEMIAQRSALAQAK